MSKKKMAKVTVFVVFCWILFNIGGNLVAAEKVLRIRIMIGIRIFDPARATLHEGSIFTRAVYDNLVDYTPGAWPELENELAEKYEVSQDGMVYTFHLKKGVQWQKGYGEFTAEDVKFSMERVMDPKTKAPLRGVWSSVIDRIETPDRYTVKVILKKHDPAFLSKMAPWRAGSIVSKRAVEKFGEDYGRKPESIVGAGPFQVVAWIPDQKIVLERFDQYHGTRPKVDRMEILLIKDESTAVLSLQKGELDICYIRDLENILTVKKDPNLNVYQGPSGTNEGIIGFNLEHPILKDVRVRRGMAHALDVGLIREQVAGETGFKACGFLAPGVYLGALSCEELPSYSYAPEKAKALLAEAGYPNGFKIKYFDLDHKTHRDMAVVVQAYWSQVGIDAEIELLPTSHLVGRMFKADMPVFKYPIGTRPPEPSIFLHGSFHSSSSRPGLNTFLYKGVDQLLDKAIATRSEKERIGLYAQIQKKIIEDCVFIPIYHVVYTVATRKNVTLGRGAEGKKLTGPYWYYYWLEEMGLK